MKLIILDRDGVINQDSAEYIKSPDEWVAIEGSVSAIVKLNHAGFRVVIATNQSGIGRRLFSIETLHLIHKKMLTTLAEQGGHIDGIFFCPHVPEDRCNCRKPKPGLLQSIANRYSTNLQNVSCVGDSLRDIEAAALAGAKPILVKTGNGVKTLKDPKLSLFEFEAHDTLKDYVDQYLSGQA